MFKLVLYPDKFNLDKVEIIKKHVKTKKECEDLIKKISVERKLNPSLIKFKICEE